jgi:E3 ubiquitin-protein ligase HUWE1
MAYNPEQISTLSFQEKSAWFRFNLEKLRISWMKGADFMHIEKNNVLMSSLIESKKVNMYKEVKIEFVGDKVNDAGGLLREWMHLVIN